MKRNLGGEILGRLVGRNENASNINRKIFCFTDENREHCDEMLIEN